MIRTSIGIFAAIAGIAVVVVIIAVLVDASQISYNRVLPNPSASTSITPEIPRVKHVATPLSVKAIYMTQCAVGTLSFRQDLMSFIEETELNSIIIDIKDYTGGIAFPTNNPELRPYVSEECGAVDMKEFVKELHDEGIYVIGRITVFQDPLYTSAHPELAVKKESATSTVWTDHKGLAFVDVGARPFWNYIITLSQESYNLGFDELNFDYIRFPSDGNMNDIHYPWSRGKDKQVALEEFFKYLHEKLKPDSSREVPVLSADLFGMTTTNEDDLNIGQVLERALPYFDYIAPMVYPSHYPTDFLGLANVNEHSYDIVLFSMSEAVRRTTAPTTPIESFAYTPIMRTFIEPATETTATTTREEFTGLYKKPEYPASKMRPWLQSFDYPVPYTPEMVAEQIQANTDAGLDSWMFWDPANRYRSLRAVLKEE